MKADVQINTLLNEYAPLLARVAATYEINQALQDELIQEMSLAVWRAFESNDSSPDVAFRGDASIKTYIARIAHNKAVDHVIKEQNRKEVASSESIDYTQALSAHKSPDDSLDLMAALRKLTLKYRQVLALQLEGFNQSEIAQTLGLSEDAVAQRASRARQQLASLME